MDNFCFYIFYLNNKDSIKNIDNFCNRKNLTSFDYPFKRDFFIDNLNSLMNIKKKKFLKDDFFIDEDYFFMSKNL